MRLLRELARKRIDNGFVPEAGAGPRDTAIRLPGGLLVATVTARPRTALTSYGPWMLPGAVLASIPAGHGQGE